MAKKKYYVVWEGRVKGIFDNWSECNNSVKAFTGAKYKSFPDKQIAEDDSTLNEMILGETETDMILGETGTGMILGIPYWTQGE